MRSTTIPALLGAAALALTLSACGNDTDQPADATTAASGSTTGTTTAEPAPAAGSLTLADPWVKAAPSGMTGVFGTLTNEGDTDLTVVSAASDVAATMELHETVAADHGAMTMRPKEGGFTVPAGGSHELAPGGDHVMAMGLTRPLEPGETVTVTLTLDDGSSTDVECTVKAFTGADEDYQDQAG
jgi:copper(I)-binding protein